MVFLLYRYHIFLAWMLQACRGMYVWCCSLSLSLTYFLDRALLQTAAAFSQWQLMRLIYMTDWGWGVGAHGWMTVNPTWRLSLWALYVRFKFAYFGKLALILKFTLLLYCTQVVTHADHVNGLPWLVQILLLIKVPNSRNYQLHWYTSWLKQHKRSTAQELYIRTHIFTLSTFIRVSWSALLGPNTSVGHAPHMYY